MQLTRNALAAFAALCLASCASTSQVEEDATMEMFRLAPEETQEWLNSGIELELVAPNELRAWREAGMGTIEERAAFYALMQAAPVEAARFLVAMAWMLNNQPLELIVGLAGIGRGKLSREVRQEFDRMRWEYSKRAAEAQDIAKRQNR
ncbi:MAG: hypothetical protein OXM59_07550 [Gammaproteobacteria bacterium]|nr:hypothetical protein [Gammaproteobacteria bacterium]